MKDLLSGAIVMGYLVAGMFFWRFWAKTKDQLFLFFCIAFWVLASQRLALGLFAAESENRAELYLPRLAAFLLIIVGIWQKNRQGARP